MKRLFLMQINSFLFNTLEQFAEDAFS